LLHIARPAILGYGLYVSDTASDGGLRRLQEVVNMRSRVANDIDTVAMSVEYVDRALLVALDRILYDIDCAIDIFAGTDYSYASDESDLASDRASAHALIILSSIAWIKDKRSSTGLSSELTSLLELCLCAALHIGLPDALAEYFSIVNRLDFLTRVKNNKLKQAITALGNSFQAPIALTLNAATVAILREAKDASDMLDDVRLQQSHERNLLDAAMQMSANQVAVSDYINKWSVELTQESSPSEEDWLSKLIPKVPKDRDSALLDIAKAIRGDADAASVRNQESEEDQRTRRRAAKKSGSRSSPSGQG